MNLLKWPTCQPGNHTDWESHKYKER